MSAAPYLSVSHCEALIHFLLAIRLTQFGISLSSLSVVGGVGWSAVAGRLVVLGGLGWWLRSTRLKEG